MKTLQELNFTEEQSNWIFKHVRNFKGIIQDELEARRTSAKLAKESGETDFHVSVHHVWNGLAGEHERFGYTVGWSKKMKPVFKAGVEPTLIDDDLEGWKKA